MFLGPIGRHRQTIDPHRDSKPAFQLGKDRPGAFALMESTVTGIPEWCSDCYSNLTGKKEVKSEDTVDTQNPAPGMVNLKPKH